jgi:hypothetical protein
MSYWFELYQKTINNYNIQPEETYNTDKKGVIIGVIGKQRYIVLKSKKNPKLSQNKS